MYHRKNEKFRDGKIIRQKQEDKNKKVLFLDGYKYTREKPNLFNKIWYGVDINKKVYLIKEEKNYWRKNQTELAFYEVNEDYFPKSRNYKIKETDIIFYRSPSNEEKKFLKSFFPGSYFFLD